MNRCLYILPLLGLAPMMSFLGSYLAGLGVLSWGRGFVIGAFGMFIVPWLVSILFSILCRDRLAVRLLIGFGALVIQGFLLFGVVPPGATCEMMGLAQRLRHEFSPEQIRDCADQLRTKFNAGTLASSDKHTDDYSVTSFAFVVRDSELPASLQGRFERIFIQKNQNTGEEEVLFALGRRWGIMCDSRKNVHDFYFYSMADGVEAYRYQP